MKTIGSWALSHLHVFLFLKLHTSHAGLYDVVVGRVYWPRLPGVDDEILDPGVGREGMYRQVDQ